MININHTAGYTGFFGIPGLSGGFNQVLNLPQNAEVTTVGHLNGNRDLHFFHSRAIWRELDWGQLATLSSNFREVMEMC